MYSLIIATCLLQPAQAETYPIARFIGRTVHRLWTAPFVGLREAIKPIGPRK